MKISKYGVVLNRLRVPDIELVRIWRNSPRIVQFMEYRKEITPEMQQEWFKSVDDFNNYYFIIEYQDQKIGLINSSKVEWDTVSSEGGIFFWEESYYETFVPVWASLCLLEFCFFMLGASRSVIKTLRDNARAKTLNTHLGYEIMEGQEEVYNQQYLMTFDTFTRHAPRIIRAASLLAGKDVLQHRLEFDRVDIGSGLADFFHEKIRKETIAEYHENAQGRFYLFNPIMA
jgi:RimJ/RimL family protein N-acetyltransferase